MRYKNFIFHVLHRMNLPRSDIDDLTQDILLILWEKLPQYNKDNASFRTWLATIIRNTALAYINKQKNRVRKEAKSIEDQPAIDGIPVSDSELDNIIEKEWAAHITNLAMERARKAFHGKAIQVFELSRQGVDIDMIARQLDITKASAYSLRTRVKNCLIKEIQLLIKEGEME